MKEENVLGGASGIGGGFGGVFGCSVAQDSASTPEWDGEGLPPVGCECEFKANDGGWGIGTVLCVGKNRIFWLCHEDGDEYTSEVNPREFRPIRSEADKKKERVVDEIMSWIHYAGRTEVELIYDAIKSGKIVID